MKERVIYKERKNTNCEKWDGLLDEYGRKDLLPVWVADMDFRTAPPVVEALNIPPVCANSIKIIRIFSLYT